MCWLVWTLTLGTQRSADPYEDVSTGQRYEEKTHGVKVDEERLRRSSDGNGSTAAQIQSGTKCG